MSSEDPAPLPNEPEHAPSHTQDEHPGSPPKAHRRTPTTTIMILGPSGSEKSSFINTIGGESFQIIGEGGGIGTTQFRASQLFTIDGRPFRLIDSPGFNKTHSSCSEVMKKLIYYLARARDRWNTRLTGILYLHPERNELGDDRLKKIMRTLREVFGESWSPFITIGVIGNGAATNSDAVLQLQDSASPFYSLHSGGAKIISLLLEAQQAQEALLSFDPSTPPPQPRFYYYIRSVPPNRIEGVERFVEEATRSHRAEAVGRTGHSRRITLEESEASRQQLQTALDESQTELKLLRSQLEQTQLEYTSLSSELQLNDNTEQSKIIQLLEDLNRAIEMFGRSVSAHMFDNFATSFNNQSPTTLDASDFAQLQRQFGHQVGKSSLAASLKGDGLPVEDFIDLALRTFLCQRLCEHVFIPFHPTLAASAESCFMATLYEKVRRQMPLTVAVKWRANTFMALSEEQKLDKPTIGRQVESLMTEDIQPLLHNLFGKHDVVTLTENQRSQLRDLVTLAWEFNRVLKGEVVSLGDFQPLYYERGVPFNSENMVGFEPVQQRKPDDVAICTIKLGLTRAYSQGSEEDTSPSVVCQATVVTTAIYGYN